MKKEKTLKKTFQKMWQDKRGKAILKLGIYFVFFLFMAILLTVMSIFNKPLETTKKPSTENKEVHFLSNTEMWENLMTQDYHYKYQVITKENQESVLYEGEKINGIDTGYRESKIGIIKYCIKEEKTYQILVETEEEITNLWGEEDTLYLNLVNLHTLLNTIIPETTKSGTTKLLKYQENDIQIEIKMSPKQITSIQIDTKDKEYKLSFQKKENQNNIDKN